jgi:H+/Cl- antiporter ClcA
LHVIFPGTNEVVMIVGLMAAANTGVTKTPIGSALVVSGMSSIRLLPTTLLATITALLLTENVGLIHTQRERDIVGEPTV